ncbi:hypothetical protein IC580_11905, partial [Cupriavidus sp. ISTL7]
PAFHGLADPIGPGAYTAELKKIRDLVGKKLLDGLEESRRERKILDIETADLDAKLLSLDYQVVVTLDADIE